MLWRYGLMPRPRKDDSASILPLVGTPEEQSILRANIRRRLDSGTVRRLQSDLPDGWELVLRPDGWMFVGPEVTGE